MTKIVSVNFSNTNSIKLTKLQVIDDFNSKILVDSQGNRTVKKYNDFDKVTEIIYADGSLETFEYDFTGKNLIKHTDQMGTTTTYTYNESGLPAQIKKEDATGDAQIIRLTYDNYGNVLTVSRNSTNGSERTTTYEYDEYGNKIKKIDAENNEVRATHNQMGDSVTITDARGHLWQQTFDAREHLLSREDPLGRKTIAEYDTLGKMISLTFPDENNPSGNKYEVRYDSHNRLIEIISPDGSIEEYEYNLDGEKTKITDGEGRTTIHQYDSLGRLIKTIDGNGNETSYGYEYVYKGGCTSCSAIYCHHRWKR